MQTQAPWTEVGRLQSDVSDIKRQLNGKVDDHEIYSLRSKVDSLEHSLREISTSLDEFRYRIEDAENKINEKINT